MIKEPPKHIGLLRSAANALLKSVRANQLTFDPAHFDSQVTTKGTAFSLKQRGGAAAAANRFRVTRMVNAGGSYAGTVRIDEGTLYFPKNVGVNVPAGDPDPEIILMIPNPFAVWEWPESTFPMELSASAGEEIFFEFTWILRVEDRGNNEVEGADTTLLSFWELAGVAILADVRASPSYDWELGTATTRFPLASVVIESGNTRVEQHWQGDMQATLPPLSERSLVAGDTGGGGGGGGGSPSVAVTIANGSPSHIDHLVKKVTASGGGCRSIDLETFNLWYLPKTYTFTPSLGAAGTVTVDEIIFNGDSNAGSSGNLKECSYDPFA